MYLAAQRVLSSHQKVGVNVYYYLHGYEFDVSAADFFLPETNPGVLRQQWIDVQPGGNEVLSYLDVVATDSIGIDALLTSLGALKHVLRRIGDQTEARWGPLWVRYGYQANLRVPWATELGALAGHIALRIRNLA